jgi:hypothetical protein
MTDQRMSILDRYGRFVWGAAALLLLLVLVGSVVLSGSSVAGAEQDAQLRAESLSGSVVEEELTADLLARDIGGTEYRDLTVRVQAGILSDDRFTVVRIWRVDSALIYSTAQKDDIGVIAGDDQWIAQALDGQTVSVLSSAGTHHDGLKRSSEEMYQTFVPIRLSSDSVVDGVVQIDQRYSAIHNQAYRVWRPVQFAVLALLLMVGVLFVRWLRNAPVIDESAPPVDRRVTPGRRADDLHVRDAVARADRAEQLARESEKRLRELEAMVAAAPSTATATAALEELDLKLRASEAEREELAGTVQRLTETLAERDAEVALSRGGSAGTRADTKRVNKLIADAESRAVMAEKKAAAAEQKTQEAARRATATAERTLEMEAQLREAEQRVADAEKLAAGFDERGSGAEKKIAEAEHRAVQAEQKLAHAEQRAAATVTELAEAQQRVLRAENDASAAAQLAAQANGKIAEAQQRASNAETRAADTHQLVAQAEKRAADAEELAAQIEKRAADAELRAAQAERRAVESVGESDAGSKRRDSAERRIAAELKHAEGERDQLAAKFAGLEAALAEAQAKIEATERELAITNLQLTASADATAAAQALEERALGAELRLADSEERFTDAQSRLGKAQTELADALGRLAELEQARNADAPDGDGAAPRTGFGASNELEARIAELENARRADIVELQRAQESFGNTQVELSNATRKLRQAEARIRELERPGNASPRIQVETSAEPAPVPSYVAASEGDLSLSEQVDDPIPSLGAFGEGGSPHTWETTNLDPEPEAAEEAPEEGLSLRERLARAAAGRKRLS